MFTKTAFLIVASLAASVPMFGLACANTTADTGNIQAAVNAGGTVTLTGTCNLSGGSVNLNNAVTLTGTATLQATSGSMLYVNSDGVTISGLTFDGTTSMTITSPSTTYRRSNVSINHNTIQNVTNGGSGIEVSAMMFNSHIDFNTIKNIAPPNFANATFFSLGFPGNGNPSPGCYAYGCDLNGTGISGITGWDNSTIDNNTFDLTASDGIHISWDWDIAQYAFVGNNVSVSYNKFTRVHRIPIEVQGQTRAPNCGPSFNIPCTYARTATNVKIAGNYTHNIFLGYDNTYGYSLVPTIDGQYINNTATSTVVTTDTNQGIGYGIENGGGNILTQGNVLAAEYAVGGTHGWGQTIILGTPPSDDRPSLYTIQNNVMCSAGLPGNNFGQEPNYFATLAINYNVSVPTCGNSGHLDTPAIALAQVGSGVISGSTQTFSQSVISTLSIKWVQYFVDGSTTPIGTQELQDVNTNFANDQKWLYHVALNLPSYSNASHTLTATATDVSGATQSLNASFTGTGGGGAITSFSPTSLTFGSTAVGASSAGQTIVLTNAGNATLTITSITITGTNSGDFSRTTTCGASLAAAASCNIVATFTPTATGTRTASITVTDNATGSPQAVAMTGTAVATAAPGVTLAPTLLGLGSIALGSSSSAQTLVLTNSGTANLTVSSVSDVGTNAADFTETTNCPGTLAPSVSCNIQITFTPTAAGTRTATLSIVDNAAGSPHTAALSGTGNSVSATCSGILQNCGFSSGQTSWNLATGNSTSTWVVDSSGPSGSLAAHVTGNLATTLSGNLELYQDALSVPANGASCTLGFNANTTRAQVVSVYGIQSSSPYTTFGLAYQPTLTVGWNSYSTSFTTANGIAAGQGRFTIQMNAIQNGDQISFQNISLVCSGSAGVSGASFAPTTLSFGSIPIGTSSTAATTSLTNSGTAPLNISSITILGANSGEFSKTTTCNTTLAVGVQCAVSVVFTPTAVGTRTASLSVADDATGSPQTIPFTATGAAGTGALSLSVSKVDYISHSSARITVVASAPVSGNAGFVGRTRSVVAPAACIGNTNGLLQPQEIGPTYSTLSPPGTILIMDIAGLAPGTNYNICPELSPDNGVTWTAGVGTALTTLALPAVHPATPIPPATFDPSYPNTAGFFTYNVLSNCSDIGTAYTDAVARQATQGTLINIPVGTVCNAANFNFSATPVDVQNWTTTNVNITNSQITLGGSPTLVEGQGIRFGRSYAALATYPSSTACEFGQGIQTGTVYTVHVINSGTNTVTLNCGNGAPMIFTDQGSVNSGQTFYWVPQNRTLKPIILRSAAPDSQLPPAGAAITPAWAPKMAIIQSQASNLGFVGPAGAVIAMGSNDGNYERMISDIRIGPGIEVTTVDSAEAHTSSDPIPWRSIIYTFPFDSNIVFDRMWFHMLGAPNRDNGGFFWDGYNTAVINSYFDNLTYFHATHSGHAAAKTGTSTVSVQSGVDNMGSGNISVPGPRTITLAGTGGSQIVAGTYTSGIVATGASGSYCVLNGFNGSGSGAVATVTLTGTNTIAGGAAFIIVNTGTGYTTATTASAVNGSAICTGNAVVTATIGARVFVGLDMANSNAFTVWTPTGMTASCSGFSCTNATRTGSSGLSCDVNDNWPKDGSGQTAVGQIACITANTTSTVLTVQSANSPVSTQNIEGDNHMIGGIGPGPYVFSGNVSEGAGLLWHHDDSGGTGFIRGDYTYTRNYFRSPFKYMYNPGNLAANPLSDGLAYYVRQPIEWKGGRRINFNGNVCDGNWVEIEASAGCMLFTSVNGMGITDVDIQNNTIMHQPGVVSLAFVTAGSNFAMTPPVLRYRLQNNLAWDIGNPNFYAGTQANPPPGWMGEGPNATEDVIINHNTIAGNTGTNPALMWNFDLNTEGVSVTNNILFVDSNQGLRQDGGVPSFSACANLVGKAFADCKFTPSYVWKNNLMIGNGQTPTSVSAAWNGLTNYYQTGASSLFTVGWFKYQNSTTVYNGNPNGFDFHLNASSPWIAGGAGVNDHSADVGADIDALNAAQGLLSVTGAPDSLVTTTSAVIVYVAADSGACSVDYSSTDATVINSFTRVTDAGGNRVRNTSLTGLSSATKYVYRVECPGNSVLSQSAIYQFKTH